MSKKTRPTTSIVLFREKEVRRIWDEEEGQWYFSVVDVIGVLTLAPKPRQYWNDMRRRIHDEGFLELSAKCRQLKLQSVDGKYYATNCADTATLLRIIQSIPSPRAEPIKQWLATVGAERIEEIENPELLADRQRAYYRAKGYPEDWIEARMRGIQVRQELTEEWEQRGATEGREYAILTAEIARKTFDMIPSAHSAYKGLSAQHNLRDHMTSLEVILTALGEATTRAIHQSHDSQGFEELHTDAQQGGAIAGDTRRQIETATGQPVASPENFLHLARPQIEVIADGAPALPHLIEDDE